jgi:hypothetical protein
MFEVEGVKMNCECSVAAIAAVVCVHDAVAVAVAVAVAIAVAAHLRTLLFIEIGERFFEGLQKKINT